jgi:aminoglycoside 6'-N-acetyltransferase I
MSPATAIVRLLKPQDAALLERVADDVFDGSLRGELVREFLGDPRHHLAVAIVDGLVVGFASGVHYVHPDKPAELFINEVGVAPPHQRQGLGRRLLDALLARGRELGCKQAWVATEPDNKAARRLYAAAGGDEETPRYVVVNFNLSDTA